MHVCRKQLNIKYMFVNNHNTMRVCKQQKLQYIFVNNAGNSFYMNIITKLTDMNMFLVLVQERKREKVN